jgi:hypothetical protein
VLRQVTILFYTYISGIHAFVMRREVDRSAIASLECVCVRLTQRLKSGLLYYSVSMNLISKFHKNGQSILADE